MSAVIELSFAVRSLQLFISLTPTSNVTLVYSVSDGKLLTKQDGDLILA